MNDTILSWFRHIPPALAGIPVAFLYGLLARLVFGMERTSTYLSTMTITFLVLVPIAIGALTIRLAPRRARRSTKYALFMPWLSIIVVVTAIGILGWEGVICIVMALPVFLILASLGGFLFMQRKRESSSTTSPMLSVLFAALLPFLASPLEMQLPPVESVRTVNNQIVVEADVETVWKHISSVPEIQPHEQSVRPFHLLGLPQPLEATLSHPGVGGVRHATFTEGLAFVETVTAWEQGEYLSFHIDIDRQVQLPIPLDQIGGPHFDVLEGTYVIEPRGDKVILHLSSRHRLTTRFNLYGGLWTDAIMWDLQDYILEIIKARAEQQSSGMAGPTR